MPQQPPSMLATLPQMVVSQIQPQGDANNDGTWPQRILNVCTCLPVMWAGVRMLRRHRTREGREYAASMLAVGTVATIYHSSSGSTRLFFRKADYWTIAASSSRMIKALWPQRRAFRHCRRFGLLAIPFKPFVVSTANTVLMQLDFASQAIEHKSIRPHFMRHVSVAVAGAAAFALEDILSAQGFSHMHSLWHCLAAYAAHTTGALVEHRELLRQSPKLKKTHDSVSSMANLKRM
jgi:hypothetical protein